MIKFMNVDEFVQARVLRGVGKFSRHVKIKNLAGANLDALRYDIRQALEFDAR